MFYVRNTRTRGQDQIDQSEKSSNILIITINFAIFQPKCPSQYLRPALGFENAKFEKFTKSFSKKAQSPKCFTSKSVKISIYRE